MDKISGNVVPFDRPASYWVSRARKCRGKTRLPDAANLLSKACRLGSGDDVVLELAKTYCDMECFSAAERVLCGLLKRSPECGDAYYLLAMIAFENRDERMAENALMKCLHMNGSLENQDYAQDLINNYTWQDASRPKASARAVTLYFQALDALTTGEFELALDRLQRSLLIKRLSQSLMLLAEISINVGSPENALLPLLESLKLDRWDSLPPLLLLCEAYYMVGARKLAIHMLEELHHGIKTHTHARIYAQVCCKTECGAFAEKYLETAIASAPQSTDLLYILAALKCSMGDRARAQALLNTILSIDHEDQDALTGLKQMKEGNSIRFDRERPYAEWLNALLEREAPRGDARLKRLTHGLTISLGGAFSYAAVDKLVSFTWARMNEAQKKQCDLSRYELWPRAFYRYLADKAGIKQGCSPFYTSTRYARRVRRMIKFILAKEPWSEIK